MTDKLERDCTTCDKARYCSLITPYRGFYCAKMEEAIDHYEHSKEPLASDLMGEGYEGFANRDYKEVINEVGEMREDSHDRWEDKASDLPMGKWENIRKKAITHLLNTGMTKRQIMRLFRISERTFYRTIQINKEEVEGA